MDELGVQPQREVVGVKFEPQARINKVVVNAVQRNLPQSIGGIALDYAFSVFNIGLALFLLRLRPRNVTARLLAVGMTGTSALFNLQASAYLGEEALTG